MGKFQSSHVIVCSGKSVYLPERAVALPGNYLKDGSLELSNNRVERSIKPFVINRKNFLFVNTPKGVTGSAVMFSLIQTAIENGLDPYQYLTWLFMAANHADLDDWKLYKVCSPGMPQQSVLLIPSEGEFGTMKLKSTALFW